jgi:prevent-host-death family protein
MKDIPRMEIGAYEAKTRLPELLRQVKAGRRFTITNRGEAIADLVPSEAGRTRNHKAVIEKFQKFIDANPVRGRVNVRELIEEGRE